MTKDELLSKIRVSRSALLETLQAIPPEECTIPGVTGDWSVKDILVHINYWEGQLITMLFQLREGQPPTSLALNQPDVDAQNEYWFQQGKDREWQMAWNDFTGLHSQMIRRVSAFSDKELNDPRLHAKLAGRPLWEWIAGDSFEHEDEHNASIQYWLKNR
jgi:hypothetical protein